MSAGVCSLSVDAVPVTGGCCAADNTQPSPADFRSIFQIVIKRTAATSNKYVTIKIIIIVKCKIVHYRLYYRQVTSHSHCLAAHETWNVGSCDDGSGPGAGWARLELGWAATATESTTMTYEGKILLIK